jgi:hypothetical protein
VVQPFPYGKNKLSGKPAQTQQVLTNELQSQLQGVEIFAKSNPTNFAYANSVFLVDWLYPILSFKQPFSQAVAIRSAKAEFFGRSTLVQFCSYQFKIYTSLPVWSPP